MKIDTIIEGLNEHINDRRKINNLITKGHLVLQKIMTPNTIVKAYKSYEVILWFIKDNEKYRIIRVKQTDKVIASKEEELKQRVNKELCHQIFNWINSNGYNQVVEGTFKEDYK